MAMKTEEVLRKAHVSQSRKQSKFNEGLNYAQRSSMECAYMKNNVCEPPFNQIKRNIEWKTIMNKRERKAHIDNEKENNNYMNKIQEENKKKMMIKCEQNKRNWSALNIINNGSEFLISKTKKSCDKKENLFKILKDELESELSVKNKIEDKKWDEEDNFIFNATWHIILLLDLINTIIKMVNLDNNFEQYVNTNPAFLLNNANTTPLNSINPNLIYKNSLSTIEQSPISTKSQVSKIENLGEGGKRKITHEESSDDDLVEKALKITDKEQSVNKKTKKSPVRERMLSANESESISLIKSNRTTNYTRRGQNPGRSSQTTNNMLSTSNGENQTNNKDQSQTQNGRVPPPSSTEVMETEACSEKECPVSSKHSEQKREYKPRVVTREDLESYKNKQRIDRPNAILIHLTQEQVKWVNGVNMVQYTLQKLKAKLDEKFFRGYSVLGTKLFLYPLSTSDHDHIIRNSNWPLGSNEQSSLENKGSSFILKGISVNEINNNYHIKKELEGLGVKHWEPLIKGEMDHTMVRCECASRADLTLILSKCYVDGRKFKLINGKEIYVSFNPSIAKPNQCYKCLKFTDHLAANCNQQHETCGRCGNERHEECEENCMEKKFCVNCPSTCNSDHGSRELRKCKRYQDIRTEALNQKVFFITGRMINRPLGNKNERYAVSRKKMEQGLQVAEKFDCWENSANIQVTNVQRQMEEKAQKWEGDLLDVKSRAVGYVDNMDQILKLAQKAYSEINERIDKAVERKTEEHEKWLQELENRAEEVDGEIDRLDKNLAIISDWSVAVDKKQVAQDVRLMEIEAFINKCKQHHSESSQVQFW
jgi:hypothetical protein